MANVDINAYIKTKNENGNIVTFYPHTKVENVDGLDAFGASGSNHSSGLVPDPGAAAGSSKYLCEDGTWSVPAGSTIKYAKCENVTTSTTDSAVSGFEFVVPSTGIYRITASAVAVSGVPASIKIMFYDGANTYTLSETDNSSMFGENSLTTTIVTTIVSGITLTINAKYSNVSQNYISMLVEKIS